jgi:hypothetical protein
VHFKVVLATDLNRLSIKVSRTACIETRR